MIRKILRTFGLALYSDLKKERDEKIRNERASEFAKWRIDAAKCYIKEQRSNNGVVYLGEGEQNVLFYVLENTKDDEWGPHQRIKNAKKFVEAHS